jgi:hypothetical protein
MAEIQINCLQNIKLVALLRCQPSQFSILTDCQTAFISKREMRFELIELGLAIGSKHG